MTIEELRYAKGVYFSAVHRTFVYAYGLRRPACRKGAGQQVLCARAGTGVCIRTGARKVSPFGRSLHERCQLPVYRVVQLGFMEKAEELGYEGHILGLEEGGMQEQYDCWLQGAQEHDIGGAVCWVGGDSAYEFLKSCTAWA